MQLMYVGENLRKAQFLTAHTCSRQTGAPKPLRSTSCICSDSINLPVHDHSHMPAMPCGCSIESCLQTICHGLWHNDLCEMLQGARKLQASTHNNMPWASWKETTLTWASHECLARIYQGALVTNPGQPCWGLRNSHNAWQSALNVCLNAERPDAKSKTQTQRALSKAQGSSHGAALGVWRNVWRVMSVWQDYIKGPWRWPILLGLLWTADYFFTLGCIWHCMTQLLWRLIWS